MIRTDFIWTLANGSPPPIDPQAEEDSSYTTETITCEIDDSFDNGELDATISSQQSPSYKMKRYHRKRVTFDLPGSCTSENGMKQQPSSTQKDAENCRKNQDITNETAENDLLTENDQLRNIISEMEKSSSIEQSQQIKKV